MTRPTAARLRRAPLLGLLWLAALPAAAVELPGPLVSTAWLAEHIDAVLVLDVREDAESYEGSGHIVGAVELRFGDLRGPAPDGGLDVGEMSLTGEALAAPLRAAGLSAGMPVVLTHRGRSIEDTGYATYLFWQLRRMGHGPVALLDGGTKAWIDEGREIWGERDEADPGDFAAADPVPGMAVETPAVQGWAGAGGDLVDARPLSWFIGLDKRPDLAVGGHIPGAAPMPYELLFMPDATFRPAEALEAAAAAMGLSRERPVAAYCNTAHVSSMTWFVLAELLGWPDVALYDGSMLAWSAHGLPVAQALR